MMSDLFLGGYSSVVITDEKENSCTELNTTRTPTKNYHDLKLSMDDKSESGSQFNTDGTHTNSLKKRALSSRNSNVHYRSTAEDSRQDPEQKKQRSSFTSNQHTCINEASASKYDQDKYQDSETLYPDTLKSYFEELSDGFRTDFKELFQNGIRAFDTSLKFLLPNPFSSNSGDSLQDLEIRSVRTTPSMVPISDDTSRPSVLPKKISKEEKAAKQLQVDAALRMRCPSMWDKKETNIKLSTTQNPETPTECQSIAVANNSTGSNVSNTLRNKGKECRKISLTKLYNNQSITYFPCDDNKILILGNKRLMLVSKDSIDVALGNVDWCESVLDVDKCNMSFQSRY